jgi:hypothetical protein
VRSGFLTALAALAVCLSGCGADLNPQPEPPGNTPITTGGATGSSTTGSSTNATTVGTGVVGTAGGTGGSSSGGSGGGGGGSPGSDAAVSPTVDGGSDATNDAQDGSTPPDTGDAAPFPACTFVDTLDRHCAIDDDCAVAVHQTDCCGNTFAIGLNHADHTRFDASEPACAASYPRCGCPTGPTRTDSNETAPDPATIHAGCITSGPTKQCRTYVTNRPPDAP